MYVCMDIDANVSICPRQTNEMTECYTEENSPFFVVTPQIKSDNNYAFKNNP